MPSRSGTLYVHFAGKEAVLLELLDGAPLAKVLQAAADATLSAERRLGVEGIAAATVFRTITNPILLATKQLPVHLA